MRRSPEGFDGSWRASVTNALLAVLGLILVGLSHQLTVEFHRFVLGFAAVAGWSIAVYVAAALIVLTQPTNRYTLPLVLIVALACRLMTLLPAPFLSSDIYRYVWDGIVQHAHISPYRYVPGDPTLRDLQAAHSDIFDHINRRNYARTIYPPLAQVLFLIVTSFRASVVAMKLAMIVFEGIAVYALVRLISSLGRSGSEVLLYAWCPLLLWEVGSSGHLDAAVIGFLTLALLARSRRLPVATGICLRRLFTHLGSIRVLAFLPPRAGGARGAHVRHPARGRRAARGAGRPQVHDGRHPAESPGAGVPAGH